MNLVVDIGNTQSKVAVFRREEMMYTEMISDISPSFIQSLLSKFVIKSSIISSVKEYDREMEKALKARTNFVSFSYKTPLPVALNYKTPETLGKDRIAAVVAASKEFNTVNILVIDMGTCITYDFINADAQYLGGGISPGFNMRLKALNEYTGNLPLVSEKQVTPALIGNSTENSIVSGVFFGIENEVKGIISLYEQQYKDLKIVITGGNMARFDIAPKNRIFADKFLVLKGLNNILNYNAKV